MAGHDSRLDGRTGAGGAPAARIERSTTAFGARAGRRHLGGRPRAGAAPSRRRPAPAGGERRDGFLMTVIATERWFGIAGLTRNPRRRIGSCEGWIPDQVRDDSHG